jgi:hypothetical protein
VDTWLEMDQFPQKFESQMKNKPNQTKTLCNSNSISSDS